MSKIKQVIIVRKDLKMRRGKECAQVAHASMKVFFDRMSIDNYISHKGGSKYSKTYLYTYFCEFTKNMKEWMNGLFTKVVVSCDSEEELLALQKVAENMNIINALIQDAGLTEFKENCTYCKGKGLYEISAPKHSTENSSTQFCSNCKGTGKISKQTYTCLAVGPDYSEKIDKVTKHLKLK